MAAAPPACLLEAPVRLAVVDKPPAVVAGAVAAAPPACLLEEPRRLVVVDKPPAVAAGAVAVAMINPRTIDAAAAFATRPFRGKVLRGRSAVSSAGIVFTSFMTAI